MADELATATTEKLLLALEQVESALTSGPIGRVSGERYIRADLVSEPLEELRQLIEQIERKT